MSSQLEWDLRFLALAKHVSLWSKDPSTKCGAVIVDQSNRIVSLGYNGFPRHVHDTEKRLRFREEKYKFIVHADMNAIIFAKGELSNCTIYTWPFLPCSECTKVICQKQLERVVTIEASSGIEARWGQDLTYSRTMFNECSVLVKYYTEEQVQ